MYMYIHIYVDADMHVNTYVHVCICRVESQGGERLVCLHSEVKKIVCILWHTTQMSIYSEPILLRTWP